jgi:hypothetical protein
MPDRIKQLRVDRFNADLAELDSTARVATSSTEVRGEMLELQDDEGNFLDFIPDSASPEIVATAYRLYGRGLNHGVRDGEAAAWAKLRHLIGAAPSKDDI